MLRRIASRKGNRRNGQRLTVFHKKPEVTITIIKSDSWRETPTAPKGYFLISNSIVTIFNEVTGYPYQYYKCIRLTPLQNLRAT